MKRLLLSLFVLLLVPATAFGQVVDGEAFPSNDSELLWTHGVAVDPDGKVWIQPFGGPREELMVDGETVETRVLKVYNADGTEWDNSPIIFAKSADGAIADTLGGFTNADGAWEQKSGRGLETAWDGHILVSQWNTLYKFNYMTGEAVAKIDLTSQMGDPRALTAAAASKDAVFVTGVWPGNAIWELDPMDLSVKGEALPAEKRHGFSRSFAASPDGNHIFWAGYSTNAVWHYQRADEFAPFDSMGVVIQGVAAESFEVFDPGNDAELPWHLWVGSGSGNDMPNMFAPDPAKPDSFMATFWESQTHYAFNIEDIIANHDVGSVASAIASVKWDLTVSADEDGAGRPRGIAITRDGSTAYVTQFAQNAPSTQKFALDLYKPMMAGPSAAEGGFPSNDSELLWTHGVAVDPDGKVWIQPFGGPREELMVDGETVETRVLKVYNADGTEWDNSPIVFARSADGAIADTLGGFTNADGAWEQKSGRGLETAWDGHILVSQWNTLYKFNYMTGEAVAKIDLTSQMGDPRALTAAAASKDAVFVTGVWPGNAIWELDPMDLSVKGEALPAEKRHGFSRSFAASPDGNHIFWAGYSTNAVWHYQRADEFAPFDSMGVVIQGVAAESFEVFDPGHDAELPWHLWVGSGSGNDMPNMFAPDAAAPESFVPTFWQSQTHYAFNIADIIANHDVTSVPSAIGSITWDLTVSADEDGAGRPRGIAITRDGSTAYVTQFAQNAPSTQKFMLDLYGDGVTSAEDEPFELPEQFVLHQNYPNPFNPSTTIEYDVMEAAPVTVRIYDTLGRVVSTLVSGEMQQPGRYRINWDAQTAAGGRLASGMYFYSLETPNFRQVRQMVLVK